MRCALLDQAREQPGGEALLAAAYEGVHLVGGAVRDLLRAGHPRELDVLVEADRQLACRVGIRPRENVLVLLGGEIVYQAGGLSGALFHSRGVAMRRAASVPGRRSRAR